jgi:predicted metalloprotease with PDZ domain
MNTPGIHYRVAVLNAHAHLFEVTLTVPEPAADQVLALPVWIPGSYLVREFSQHMQHLSAQQNGTPVALTQLDKHRWQLNGHQPGQPVTVRCEVYAFDASVRTAYLDDARGFFNGTSLCLRVVGQEERPHRLQVDAPALHDAGIRVQHVSEVRPIHTVNVVVRAVQGVH